MFLQMTGPLDGYTTPPEEVEIRSEKILGHPLAGKPAERIEAMEKRIAYLEDQRRCSEHTDEPLRSALFRTIEADLAEARQQLKEWQAQQQGRN
jgi:hypothetical protein